MKAFYKKIVEVNEERIPHIMANLYEDRDSIFYGGYRDGNGLAEQYATLSQAMHCAAAYFCEDSRYYKDKAVMELIKGFIRFYFNTVRENGTGDCLISDFYTPSSFEGINVAHTYRIFCKYAKTEEEREVGKSIYRLLEVLGTGLLNGGHRTPNHRWMIAASAANIYNITGNSELRDLALRYLDEGIDIDEYGEFTERSPGMYNEVNDNALFELARELKMDNLYEHLKANMDLLFKYMEPDGTIFTQNSARKDKGENDPGMGFYPTRYFYIYLQGAYFMKDPAYAAFAHQIMEQTIKYGRAVPDVLWLYMVYDGLKEFEPEIGIIERDYEMYNPVSSIYRKVFDDFSVSVIGNNANFLFVQKGDLKCYARLCASFFMLAQFKPEKIEKNGDVLSMSFSAEDMYWKAFDEKPPTSDWKKMDHSQRGTCNPQKLTITAEIKIEGKSVDIGIRTEGTDRVPFKAEFVVTGGSDINGELFDVRGVPGQGIIPHQGMVRARLGKDTMLIGPAFMNHTYTSNMRGSVPQSGRGYTIYFTDYTNVDRNIRIICS
ncbi:MAG: hypothetical protein JXB33_04155 [Clostridia bacterium]|nr:hypothetical protein [Clostridia bacterium]